jgi:hypothetical protein
MRKKINYKLPSGDAAQSDINELGSTIAGDFFFFWNNQNIKIQEIK